MNKPTAFSPDYSTARLRFRQTAIRLGWAVEEYSIRQTGRNTALISLQVVLAATPSLYPNSDLKMLGPSVPSIDGYQNHFLNCSLETEPRDFASCIPAPSDHIVDLAQEALLHCSDGHDRCCEWNLASPRRSDTPVSTKYCNKLNYWDRPQR